MRHAILSISLLLLLSFAHAPSPLLAYDGWETIKEQFNREFAFSPGGILRLENSVGEIEVTGWDQPRVEITAVKKVRYRDDPERARELLKKIDIEVKRSGDEIKIESDIPEGYDLGGGWTLGKLLKLGKMANDPKVAGINFKIKLPRRTDLKIEQSVGELEVSGITGEVRVENSVGELSLTDISGELGAETGVGEINLRHISGPADVSTGVGEITLYIPADAAVELDASCGTGEIDCDLPLEVKGKVFSKSLQGKINGGGPCIELSTGLGEINIKKGK